MKNLNSVSIEGRITHNPELRVTSENKYVCSFQIAVNDKHKSYFFNIVTWTKQAKFVYENFKKGDIIKLIGYLTYREHTGEDGIKREIVEIVARDVGFPLFYCKKEEIYG